MIKEELVEYVTSFFNEENEAEFNLEIDALNSAELFHYHTVKRLHKAYKLCLENDDFLGDFLIAFRDYMITYNLQIILCLISLVYKYILMNILDFINTLFLYKKIKSFLYKILV